MAFNYVSPAAFYAATSCSMYALWLFFSIATGGDVHRRLLTAPIATRPAWFPLPLFLALLRPTSILFFSHAAPALLLCCAFVPHVRWLRIATATVLSLFNLADSSLTQSHRDYAPVYTCWALALLPDDLAAGATLGICVHFLASSGIAKVYVGGTGGWSHARTMGAILEYYSGHDLAKGGPLSVSLSAWVLRQPRLLRLLGASTLLFECVLAPAALVLPPGASRLILAVVSLGLHVGIAMVQSLVIGLAFLPAFGTYLFGFGCGAPALSGAWACALPVAALTPVTVALRGQLLPESWPCSPFALFPFNQAQWDALFGAFELGRTRLVLSTAALSSSNLVGQRICGKGGFNQLDGAKGAVFNGWERVVGDTTFHWEVLQALNLPRLVERHEARSVAVVGCAVEAADRPWWAGWSAKNTPEHSHFVRLAEADYWDVETAMHGVEDWLVRRRRMVEVESGRILERAYFVRLDAEQDVVAEVLREW